jgi:hypothetical protein
MTTPNRPVPSSAKRSPFIHPFRLLLFFGQRSHMALNFSKKLEYVLHGKNLISLLLPTEDATPENTSRLLLKLQQKLILVQQATY